MLLFVNYAGINIVSNPSNLIAGEMGTLNCSSTASASKIEWLLNGNPLYSSDSQQFLTLTFNVVNDSIHRQTYTCRVTRNSNMVADQNFTVTVTGTTIVCIL